MNTIKFEHGEGNDKKMLIIKASGKTEREIMSDIVRHIKNITTEFDVRSANDEVKFVIVNVIGDYVMIGKLRTEPFKKKLRVKMIPYSGKEADGVPSAVWKEIKVEI